MDREDFFLKIAELHLKRVEILQTVEWRVTFSLWTFVAGVAMVSLANADKMKQATIVMGDILGPVVILSLMGGIYVRLWYLYLYKFCKKNYNSLVTERNRYQRMQNEAIKLILKSKSADFLIEAGAEDKRVSESDCGEPSFKQLSGDDFRKSGVWEFKRGITAALMFFSWLLVLMIVVPSAGKHLNDSITATGKPVGVEVESSGRNLRREADQHF
ncbi:hypothetical protein [Nitrosomonas sp.]|uniref:hypothetical protein n=1 Tax=Nitrosomonas sp. TaxID=42353 RepID=UPI0025F502A6|nr:hypothetical protein [Nitrosomonas sp.]MCC6916454.1 hypothetical protein [Nitrosomonas sp.]